MTDFSLEMMFIAHITTNQFNKCMYNDVLISCLTNFSIVYNWWNDVWSSVMFKSSNHVCVKKVFVTKLLILLPLLMFRLFLLKL